jgi:hypothetical protein
MHLLWRPRLLFLLDKHPPRSALFGMRTTQQLQPATPDFDFVPFVFVY